MSDREKVWAFIRYLNRVQLGRSAELRLAAADAVDPTRTFADRDAAYCRVAMLIGESGVVIPAASSRAMSNALTGAAP